MRFIFDSAELIELYERGYSAKIRLPPDLIKAFFRVMLRIEAASNLPQLANNRGLRLEKLHGDRQGQYSVRLNDQFRLVFTIRRDDDGELLIVIEIVDYH